ncbi:MAG: PorV/PorQ family protein [Bacteroidota bacterium]|jgi:hypothetical protein
MKQYFKPFAHGFMVMSLVFGGAINSFAGNEDRAGQAGATELLINPWTRSSGWGGINLAGVRGLESQFSNVAGLAFTKKTDISYSFTDWMKGSDVKINSIGLAQRVGESGVMALSVMSVGFGDIQVTTVENPEGGLGNFKPQFFNMGISYSKSFSNSIYGGMTVRVISQSASDVKAQGVAFDAGIQYVTGFNEDKDDLRFGISLKNVGTPMKFTGDGLSFRGNPPVATSYQQTIQQRTERFELPSLISIGVSYDYRPQENHRITFAGCFISNSFTYDQYGIGAEYSFKEMFSIRGGYLTEKNQLNEDERLTALTGANAGISFDLPLGKSGKKFGIDYSYRATEFFDGSHGLGVRLML